LHWFNATQVSLLSSCASATGVDDRCQRYRRIRVTNLETDSRAVARFCSKRGTAEQWIREGKQAVKMTRLSCHRFRGFRSNESAAWLSVIAYNLGESLATAGVAKPDRQLVVDELAAAIGEDGWPIG
jgi:hypothetical protein